MRSELIESFDHTFDKSFKICILDRKLIQETQYCSLGKNYKEISGRKQNFELVV